MTGNRIPWLLVLPALILLFVIGGIPLITVVNFSFHDVFTLGNEFWVGTDWFIELLRSERLYDSLGRSFLFSVLVLLIEIPLGIYLALCLPKKGVLVSVCMVILALPLLVPWNMISMIWLSVLNEETGLLGGLFAMLHIDLNWKFNPLHTWAMIILIDVWHWTSLVTILCYSALSTIPQPYYQAAAIDSADRFQVFRHIELPRMKQVLMMAFLLRFMDSFLIYIEPFQFNAGGPNDATMFLGIELGQEIAAFNYGPSAARSVIYFIFILTVAWAFNMLLNRTSDMDREVGG